MNTIRVASLCFVVALVFAPLPAQAQTIEERVSRLEKLVGRLQSSVTTLQSSVTTLKSSVTTLKSSVTTLQSRVTTLRSNVTTLQSGQAALEAADIALQNNINAEAGARTAADTTLQTNINNEATARAAADTAQESGQFDAADLVGTYAMHMLGIEMQGAPARIGTETSVATMSLNADGTVGGTGTDGRCDLQQGVQWLVTCDPSGPEDIPPGVLSWTVENGMLVISEPGDETMRATIGAGGRILVAGGTSTIGGSWSNIVVMIRLPNP